MFWLPFDEGVAIATLLNRFPRMELAGEPSFTPSYIMRAMTGLPICLGSKGRSPI